MFHKTIGSQIINATISQDLIDHHKDDKPKFKKRVEKKKYFR